MRRPLLDRLVRLWQTDRGFSALLGSLVVVVIIIPPLMSSSEAPSLLALFFSQLFLTLVFVSGIVAADLGRVALVVASAVIGAAIVLFWVQQFMPSLGLGAWRAAAGVLAIGFLTVLVLLQVFRDGPITLQRIQGAVAVYLLIGLTWANVYTLIEQLTPGAFQFSRPAASAAELLASFGYFSFVTLTTMGYGDILPVHPVARSAAILEALVGQLFPAILIARLVAMELSARDPR